MTLMDVLSIFSLFVGILSIGLAVFTMISSNRSEQRSKENFDKTQEMIRQFYDRTKELLNEIDKRSTVTETIVTNSQEKLLNTMTTIINETIIPKKEDMGEQMGLMFMQQLFTNPESAASMMNSLKPFIDMMDKK